MKISPAGGLSGLLLNQLIRLSPTQGAILMALTAENRGIRGKYSLDAILDYHVPTKSSDVRLAYEQVAGRSRRQGTAGRFMSGENSVCFANRLEMFLTKS